MQLKLALSGTVIASVPLNAAEAANLEYVYAKRSLLTEACASLIATYGEQPVYYIEVPSKMNNVLKD